MDTASTHSHTTLPCPLPVHLLYNFLPYTPLKKGKEKKISQALCVESMSSSTAGRAKIRHHYNLSLPHTISDTLINAHIHILYTTIICCKKSRCGIFQREQKKGAGCVQSGCPIPNTKIQMFLCRLQGNVFFKQEVSVNIIFDHIKINIT